MTTAIYVGGVLGIDSQLSDGDHLNGKINKLVEVEGRHFAVLGSLASAMNYISKLTRKGKKADLDLEMADDETQVLELLPTSRLRVYELNGYLDLDPPGFHVFGHGRKIALGALLVGASPLRALRAAAEADPFTAGPYKFVRFDMVDNAFVKWSEPA